MNEQAIAMTAELRDELAANNLRRLIDPASRPARFHNLKAMGQSAAHCFQSFQDERDKESLSMRLGSGSHAILFGQPVALFDAPSKKGTGKSPRNGAVWEAFKAAHADEVILNAKEMRRAQSIANAIKSNEIAARLLFSPGVKFEETILWKQGNRTRRSTPDARGTSYIVDLKTTRCAEPDRFTRDAIRYGYHAQLADYRCAVEALVGVKPKECYIIAVETVPPYAVTTLELTARALDRGEALCRGWMERLLVCEENSHWPAYRECIETFDVPDDDIDLVFGDAEPAGDETEGE